MRTGLAMAVAAASAAVGVLAGCGDSGDAQPATATQGGLATSTAGSVPPPQTVTATATVTGMTAPPAPSAPPVPPPAPTAVAPPPVVTPAAADPVAVLNAYFDAVNTRDYPRAWALGGSVFANNYAGFVSDHATKAHYDLTVLSVGGSVVEAAMDVTLTDGGHQYYRGTYTVRDGVIAGTTMRETSSWASPAPGATVTPPPSGQAPLHFKRCADASAAGVAPITSGQPGYAEHLDADQDGVACESPTQKSSTGE